MRLLAIIAVLAVAGLTACSTQETAAPVAMPEPTIPAVGSDRDAHGCIPSAGYQWCARTAQCERSWELAKAKGFEVSAEAFDNYCKAAPPPPSGG